MTAFAHREGPATMVDPDNFEGLTFFQEHPASEHWFPSYSEIRLDLTADMLTRAVHLLNAAETVAGVFGKLVDITTDDGAVGWLDINVGDHDGDGWRTGYTEFHVRVTHGTGEVRWCAASEYGADELATIWISRENLLAMREGIIPNQ